MSGSEEWHSSSVAESSNLDAMNVDQTHDGKDRDNLVQEDRGSSDTADSASARDQMAEASSHSVAVKEEIMDSEVSSITTKDFPTKVEDRIPNSTDQHEEKGLDATSGCGRTSNDMEIAALSPCFPLIRDKDDLALGTGKKEPVNEFLDCKNENKIESEETNLDKEDSSDRKRLKEEDLETKNDPGNGTMAKLDSEKYLEENKNKEIDIVSSSLDKKSFVLDDDKDVWSAVKDVCDSSREPMKETEDESYAIEEDDPNVKSKSENFSDEEIDNSAEASADLSFVSSVEDEEEQDPAKYNQITENVYLVDKKKTRLNKEIRRIRCDCVYEPDEPGFVGCGSSCLNRLLMIECGNKCGCGEFCTNKNFQKGCIYDLEVFRAGKKGWGVRTNERIDSGSFIIEYCGEVVNYKEFMQRTETYDQEKRRHYYFMLLKGDEVIDATRNGSISRFINHSCNPNCVTQKWTVNGFLRVGFFSLREIKAGEELSFDYQYQRYGEKAQRCFCESVDCRGVIGGKQVVLKPSGSNGESSKRRSKKKVIDYASDYKLEDDISELLGDEKKIATSKQALELTRLMVKTETIDDRRTLLKIVRDQSEFKALKAFIRFKGLSLLWSWMVDTPSKDMNFRAEVLNTLKILPIPNKNHLVDSKILPLVEKWSRCNDSPDFCATRSDEDGSSSENEVGGADAKKEPDDCSKSKTEKQTKNAAESKNASTDEESDNSEKHEEVESMANELLDRWKQLREVFKIPKKTQLTPEQPKQVIDSCSSPGEEKRIGKRKIEGDKSHRLFSPNKRPFGNLPIQRTQSPIRPLMQESPNSPFRPESPAVSAASPSSGWHASSNEAVEAEQSQKDPMKSDLIQRLRKLPEQSEDARKAPGWRNVEKKTYSEESKPSRGRGRIARVANSLSWRNNPQLHEDRGIERGFRGGRGGRVQARGRGRGGFHSFAHQHYNDGGGTERQQPTGNAFDTKVADPVQSRNFTEGNVMGTPGRSMFLEGSRIATDGNRMKAPYNFQALSNSHQDRPTETVSRDNIHLERQRNIHADRQDNASQRFQSMRHPARNINHFGKPAQDWQTQGAPFTNFSNQQGFSPSRLTTNVNPVIPTSNPPPQHFSTPPPSSQPPPPSLHPQSNPIGNWTPNWPLPPQQNFPPQNLPPQNLPPQNLPPQNLPPQNLPSQNLPPQNVPPSNLAPHNLPSPSMNPVGLMNRLPNLASSNPAQVPPFPFSPERLQAPPVIQRQQQQQPPPPFFDASQPPPFPHHAPPKMIAVDPPQDQSQSTPASIIKHLHELAQQTKLASAQQQQVQQARQQQQQPAQQESISDEQGTPETAIDNGISYVTPVKEKRDYKQASGNSDVTGSSKSVSSLPPNWKTATDPEGKVYYYHVISRKTQWDLPKWEDEELSKQSNQRHQSSLLSGPRTPPASPPHSPISPAQFPQRLQAISDPSVSTTRMSAGHSAGQTEQLTPKQQKVRDLFKNKLSAVVVNCLNPYQKVDCKQARIAKVEDFKFLARKLTHGLMMKELSRVKADEELECNDSVKIKVKEYIRNYMRKFGQFYIRS